MKHAWLFSLAVFAVALTARAGTPEWRHSGLPRVVDERATGAWDAVRHTLVLLETKGADGGTFERAGEVWTRRADAPFEDTALHSAVFDAGLGHVVVYEGKNHRTWTWDGAAWTELVTAKRPAVNGDDYTMVYDSVGKRTLLVDTDKRELWALQGSAPDWSRVATGLPYVSSVPGIAFDPLRNRLVVPIGGSGTDAHLAEWDGTTWTPIDDPALAKNEVRGMVFDASRKGIVVYGIGDTGNDTGLLDGSGVHALSVPPVVDGTLIFPVMVFDEARSKTLLLGGEAINGTTSAAISALYELTDATWVLRDGGSPDPTYGLSLVRDPMRNEIVASGLFYERTWTFGASGWSNKPHDVHTPTPRLGAASAFDAPSGKVLMHGGSEWGNPDFYAQDTWAWDGAAWSSVATMGPGGDLHEGMAMATDGATGHAILFGGYHGEGALEGRTFRWNGSGFDVVVSSGPEPRFAPAMALDEARKRVVLFGGSAASTSGTRWLDDTWEFDGTTWTRVNVDASPAPRQAAAIAYDPELHAIVIHGGTGSGGVVLRDTWSFDGAKWTRLGDGPTRQLHAIAWDDHRHAMVLFGGNDGASSALGDTWFLSTPADPGDAGPIGDGGVQNPVSTPAESEASGCGCRTTSARGSGLAWLLAIAALALRRRS